MPIDVGGHYQIEVIAKLNGEDCNNTLHYYCGGGTSNMQHGAEGFRALWRAQILPLVSDQYIVDNYVIKHFEGAIWKSTNVPPEVPPVWPRVAPLLRFQDVYELAGAGAADTGSITTAEMPSFVAVGANKRCGPTMKMDMSPYPYSKFMRGGCRFGGIPEAQTDDGVGNQLNAAALSDWQDACIELRSWSYATAPSIGPFGMEVWSLFDGKTPRVDAGLPIVARASVVSFAPSVDLTSQVSRKAGRGQ